MTANNKSGTCKYGTGKQEQTHSARVMAAGGVNKRGGGVVGQPAGRSRPAGEPQFGYQGQPLASGGSGGGPKGKIPKAT